MNLLRRLKDVDRDRRRQALFRVKVAVLFIVLLPLAVSYSDNKSYLSVSNKTGYYLHVIVDGSPYLYVAPDREVVHESDPKQEFFVRVFYSPGQEARESITRTIYVPFYSTSTSCSSNSSGGWSCSETPERGGSVLWEINADTMLVQPE